MKKKLNYKGESYVPNSLKNRDRLQSEVFDPIVYQNELISSNYKFKSDFPHIKDYNDLEMIRKNFSPLASINKPDIDYNEYKDADFFIIRSSNFDDVHKAIKYGFWTSTEENNKMFADSFRQNQPHKRKTLLVFRVIKERKFIGIAEIISDYIAEQKCDLWLEKVKWKGIFNIKWLFVKNVDIDLVKSDNQNKSIADLKDGSPLGREVGFNLLSIYYITDYDYKKSIFNYFNILDQREDFLHEERDSYDNQTSNNIIYGYNDNRRIEPVHEDPVTRANIIKEFDIPYNSDYDYDESSNERRNQNKRNYNKNSRNY